MRTWVGGTKRLSILARRGMGRQGTQNTKDHRAYCKLGNVARPCGLKEKLSPGVGRE